jgi:hypothetical protein
VRNPRRYLDRTVEPSLALPDVSWLRDRGYEVVDEDVLGGLELSVVLETAGVDAEYIVSAWRGDRYLVLASEARTPTRAGVRATQAASLWWLRFATASTARNVAEAFERLHDPARRVLRRGNALLVARGLDAESVTRAAQTLAALAIVAHSEAGPRLHQQRIDSPLARPRARFASRRGVKRGDPLATNTHRH